MDASKVLKEYLTKHNWTQDMLAMRCRISQTSVSRYLEGKPMTAKIAFRISEKTGIPYEQLTDKPLKRKNKRLIS